ncbi:hypothetical protein pb186bvf_002853 [Paramecium bursaria]
MGCIIRLIVLRNHDNLINVSLFHKIRIDYSQQDESTIKEHNQIQQPQESIRRDFISKHTASRHSEYIEDSSNQTIKDLISQFQKKGDKGDRIGTIRKRKKQKGISMRSLELQF